MSVKYNSYLMKAVNKLMCSSCFTFNLPLTSWKEDVWWRMLKWEVQPSNVGAVLKVTAIKEANFE